MPFPWNRFFYQPVITPALGPQLQAARSAQGLSVSDAASAAQLDEQIVMKLEGDDFFINSTRPHFLDPGYRRLVALRYASALGLNLEEVQKALPNHAPLNPPGCTFLKNLSAVSPKLHGFWKRQLLHVQDHTSLKISWSILETSFFKLLIFLLFIAVLLYTWNVVRYFSRIL